MTTIPAPDGLSYFPFQLEGIRFALAHEGTLIADEPGLGKTVQAAGVINADSSIRTILIICPAVMRLVWKRELERWLTRGFTIGVVGIDHHPTSKDIIICNYDRLHHPEMSTKVCNSSWDLAVLDESHYCMTPTAIRTKIATTIKAKRRLALSGTPLLNHPVELLPVLTWLSPALWPKDEWFRFSQRYGGAIFNGFGWQYSGATNRKELSVRLRASVMIRRLKREVLPELPAKLRTVVELPASGQDLEDLVKAELKTFDRFEAAFAEGAESEYRKSVRDLKVNWKKEWENLSVARHQTALAKVSQVAAFVSESLTAGVPKIVVWCHHRDVAGELQKRLGHYNPVLLLGGMASKQRQKAIDDFQTDPKIRIFIGGITAAGIGITLTATSHCIFAELTWVPAQITQAEDRLHRIGAKDNVLVQHLVLAGSLDAVMARVILKKQEILDAVLEKNPIGDGVKVCYTTL